MVDATHMCTATYQRHVTHFWLYAMCSTTGHYSHLAANFGTVTLHELCATEV